MTVRFDHDAIIVGQGLAGTAMAWALRARGCNVLVIDPGEAATASRIAAGLITPIGGPQFTVGWRSDHERDTALAFYRRIERETGTSFLSVRTSIRLLNGAAEVKRWKTRCDLPGQRAYLVSPQPEPVLSPDIVLAPDGGFAMHAAQLESGTYLDASARAFEVRAARLDWRRDVVIAGDYVAVLGRRARWLIACDGAQAARNPYFDWLPFRLAKGEILTIRTARALPPVTFHQGIWIAPTDAPDIFKVGATFTFDDVWSGPSDAGRAEVEQKLQGFFRVPYVVIDQQAAVRPIIEALKLCIGKHPRLPRLACLNGLASKGVMRAPLAAEQLAAHLVDGAPLPAQDDIARFADRCV